MKISTYVDGELALAGSTVETKFGADLVKKGVATEVKDVTVQKTKKEEK